MEVMISVSEEFKIQFKKLSKRYKSLKSDIQELSDELKANSDKHRGYDTIGEG